MTFINEIVPFAGLPSYPSFLENLRFQTVGFAIVLVALGLLALVLGLIGWFFKKREAQKAVSAAAISQKSPVLSKEEDPHELLAVIAAAVYSAIGESHRIVSIRPVINGKIIGELYLQAWSMEGRRQHFASHKIR
jgi:Na+-transporting methylmalonyl-CoA/oxaloacetate decarboxylase gamma subunit